MSSAHDEIGALRAQLRNTTDRLEIAELINQFAAELDERVLDPQRFDDDWVYSFFTQDAQTTYPVGHFQGIAAIARGVRHGMRNFVRTQHIHSNILIRVAGDTATARWDLLAFHLLRGPARVPAPAAPVDLFTAGDYYEGRLVRTTKGWRFTQMILHVVWTTGTPPAV